MLKEYWVVVIGPPRNAMSFRLNQKQFNVVLEHRQSCFLKDIDPLISVIDLSGSIVGIQSLSIIRYYQISKEILELENEYNDFERKFSVPEWE